MFFKDLVHEVVRNVSINITQLESGDSLHVTLRALAIASVTNGFLLFATLLIFSLLRNKFPRIYSPRLLLNGLDFPISKLPNNLFGWFFPAFKIKDQEILQYAGLDALMFLRYLRLCLKFCIIILPYGLIVALPVNYYGGVSDKDATITGLDRLTMGNVTPLSRKLWVHFVGVWVYTFVILYLLYQEYVAYQSLRQKSLSNGDKYPHRYLVMLCDLPEKLRDQEEMKEYVDERFPGQTLGVYVMEENKQWKKLTGDYEKTLRKLAASKVEYHNSGQRPKHRRELLGFKGPKVDSISFYEQEMKNLEEKLEEERAKPHKALGHAFVAYKTLREATIAGNGLAWDYYPSQLQARLCPEKNDIVWENLTKDRRLRFIISFFMNTVVQFVMIFFWSIPVGLASSMVSFRELEKKIPALKNLEKLGPVMTGFISGFLSTVVFVLFFALLPMILVLLAYIKGLKTHNEIHNDVLEKLFVFKVLNQFALYILGSTMMERLTEILDHPSQIPTSMAKEMPSAANFFINFILLKATTVYGFELLRVFQLIVINVRRKWFVKTAADDKEAWMPLEMWYSQQYAETLLVFLISISYSVLSPLVIPFAALYFGFGYVTWMNQILFVYVPKWEGDGQMWPIVFHRMMAAIIVFLMFMIGLFGLKEYAVIATLVLPLLVICIVFWYNVNQMFTKQSTTLTFTSCIKIRDLDPDLIKKTFYEYRQNQNIPDFEDDSIANGADDKFVLSRRKENSAP